MCVLLLNAVDDAADCALFFPWNAFWNVCSFAPGGDDGGEPAAYEFESLAGIQGWILDRTLEQAPWPGQEGLPLEECGMDPRAGQPMPSAFDRSDPSIIVFEAATTDWQRFLKTRLRE